jgi:hypothetical protein
MLFPVPALSLCASFVEQWMALRERWGEGGGGGQAQDSEEDETHAGGVGRGKTGTTALVAGATKRHARRSSARPRRCGAIFIARLRLVSPPLSSHRTVDGISRYDDGRGK